jgi:cellulose synthase/poly-beta-1,6-N-acetylglucosamine synthase-like glycosyltransferase
MAVLVLAARLAALTLLAFSARRALLLAAASLPQPRPKTQTNPVPSVQVCVPCRNEAAALPGLLAALDQLDYPRTALHVSVADDASTDGSAAIARAWAATRPWAKVVALAANAGKAQALNEALRQAPDGAELVVIYDADHHPAPESLRALVAPFTDPLVAGASGQMRVANGADSPAAFYAHVESLVNQFITMRGKQRLNLAPALLGSNCAYRRSALAAVGGFRAGALLEDSDLTLALAQAGWQTRFVPEAVSAHQAPASVRGYVQQHLRWNRGFHQAAGGRLPSIWRDRRLSLPLKLELSFFALGYADRLALLAGAAFSAVDVMRPATFRFPPLTWLIYFGVPALEMLAALRLAREPHSLYWRLVYVPFFFVIDIAVAVWSSAQSVMRKPVRWEQTERGSGRLMEEDNVMRDA